MSKVADQPIQYTLTYRDVVEVLQLVRETRDCQSISLEIGPMKLSVTRALPAVAAPAGHGALAPVGDADPDRALPHAARPVAAPAGGAAPVALAPPGSSPVRSGAAPAGAASTGAASSGAASSGAASPGAVSSSSAAPGTAPAGVGVDEAVRQVRAPMLGIFYRSPSPGAPPFVVEGDAVRAGDTIGLIEVMKLFSPVVADADGRVVQIVAADATLVEHGEPLMLLDASRA